MFRYLSHERIQVFIQFRDVKVSKPVSVSRRLDFRIAGLGLGLKGSGLETRDPELRPYFERIFCIPATSAPIERIFSQSAVW